MGSEVHQAVQRQWHRGRTSWKKPSRRLRGQHRPAPDMLLETVNTSAWREFILSLLIHTPSWQYLPFIIFSCNPCPAPILWFSVRKACCIFFFSFPLTITSLKLGLSNASTYQSGELSAVCNVRLFYFYPYVLFCSLDVNSIFLFFLITSLRIILYVLGVLAWLFFFLPNKHPKLRDIRNC